MTKLNPMCIYEFIGEDKVIILNTLTFLFCNKKKVFNLLKHSYFLMILQAVKRVGWSKFLLWSVITGVLFLILDMFVAIASAPVMSDYAGLPIWKVPVDSTAGMVFDLINGVLLVTVYVIIEKCLPGKNWVKGLNYGVIVGLFRVVMMSFSTYVMYNIPLIIILTNTVAGFFEIILLCVLLVIIGQKLKIKV